MAARFLLFPIFVWVLAGGAARAAPMPGAEGSTGEACHEASGPYEDTVSSPEYRQVMDVAGSQAVTWDRLRVPPRLTGSRYRLQEVFCQRDCATCPWRPRHPGRRLGLIAQKTHVCDTGAKACLRVTREISDRCNRFVNDNFAVYHSRLWRNSPDGSHSFEKYPYTDQVLAEFGNMGPGVIVFDIRDCGNIRRLGHRMGTGELGLDYSLDAQPPAAERHRRFERSLREIPGVSAVLDAPGPAPTDLDTFPDEGCIGQGPSLQDGWQALEAQDAELVSRGEPPSGPED